MAVDKSYIDSQISRLGEFDQWFTKKEIQFLPELVNPGENILAMTSGLYEGNTWLVTVTDQRLLFLDKGMLYGLKQFEMPLDQISAITYKTGLIFGEITVSSSGGAKKIGTIVKQDVPKITKILSDLTKRKDNTFSTEPPEDDLLSKLERLADLRDRGVLTEEEFASQKERILSSMDHFTSPTHHPSRPVIKPAFDTPPWEKE